MSMTFAQSWFNSNLLMPPDQKFVLIYLAWLVHINLTNSASSQLFLLSEHLRYDKYVNLFRQIFGGWKHNSAADLVMEPLIKYMMLDQSSLERPHTSGVTSQHS